MLNGNTFGSSSWTLTKKSMVRFDHMIYHQKLYGIISVSLVQLVGILYIICKDLGLNIGHSTSPQFNCVSSSH